MWTIVLHADIRKVGQDVSKRGICKSTVVYKSSSPSSHMRHRSRTCRMLFSMEKIFHKQRRDPGLWSARMRVRDVVRPQQTSTTPWRRQICGALTASRPTDLDQSKRSTCKVCRVILNAGYQFRQTVPLSNSRWLYSLLDPALFLLNEREKHELTLQLVCRSCIAV
jgi:hypothetical protein